MNEEGKASIGEARTATLTWHASTLAVVKAKGAEKPLYAATTSRRRNKTKKVPAVYIVFDAQRDRKRTVRVAHDAPLSFFDGKHARTADCTVYARYNEIPLLKITGMRRTFEECESEDVVEP